jgi:hypothetical protein
MSDILSSKNGVTARKRKQCCFCEEMIEIGDLKDVRNGVTCGDFWAMHMHPECHIYEGKKGTVDPDWYEDSWGPAFARADAIEYAKTKGGDHV